MRKLLCIILFLLFSANVAFGVRTNAAGGGPYLLWGNMSDNPTSGNSFVDDCITNNWDDSTVLTTQNGTDFTCQGAIQEKAEGYDLLQVDLYDDVSSTSLESTWYGNSNGNHGQDFRDHNADIYLMIYMNGLNYAGNPWGRNSIGEGNTFDGITVDEDFYLHDVNCYTGCTKASNRDDRYTNGYSATCAANSSAYCEWRYNLEDPDFANFWAAKLKDVLDEDFDAVWWDNQGQWNYSNNPYPWPSNVRATAKQASDFSDLTDDEMMAQKKTFSESVQTITDAYNCCGNGAGKTNQNRDFLFFPNIGKAFDDIATTITIKDLVGTFGGMLTEGSGGYGPWYSYEKDLDLDGFCEQPSVSEWLEDVDDVNWTLTSGYHTAYKGSEQDGGCAFLGNSRMLFLLGSVLMSIGSSSDGMFFVRLTKSLNDSIHGHDGGDGNKGHWGGFTYQWGDPIGSRTEDNNSLYYRRFQNGWVFVNPSSTSRTSTVLVGTDCYQKFQDSTNNLEQNWQGLSAQQCGDLTVGAYSAELLWAPVSPGEAATMSGINAY